MSEPIEEPVLRGQRLPRETPREIRMAFRVAGGLLLWAVVAAGLIALGVVCCSSSVKSFDGITCLVLFGGFGLLFLVSLVIVCSGIPRERRLLREGLIAIGRVSDDRRSCAFRDAEGREHTVPASNHLPKNVGPGMFMPVVYDPSRPEKGLVVCAAYSEIVPLGPADHAGPPLPKIAPSWGGRPIPLETPRRVRWTKGGIAARAFIVLLGAGFLALAIYGAIDGSSTGDKGEIVCAGIIAVLGGLCFWMVFFLSLRVHALLTRGSAAMAHVLSNTEVHTHGATVRTVTYAFEDDSGRRWEGETTDASRSLSPGDVVPVFYAPENPKRSVLLPAITGIELLRDG
ncbi:DUF3592 domain-containing protein [bacterium]|nr:DUF3592 domain-containing protein [bacterium]